MCWDFSIRACQKLYTRCLKTRVLISYSPYRKTVFTADWISNGVLIYMWPYSKNNVMLWVNEKPMAFVWGPLDCLLFTASGDWLAQNPLASNSNYYMFNCIQHSSHNFSHLEPACSVYSAKLHSTADTTNQSDTANKPQGYNPLRLAVLWSFLTHRYSADLLSDIS